MQLKAPPTAAFITLSVKVSAFLFLSFLFFVRHTPIEPPRPAGPSAGENQTTRPLFVIRLRPGSAASCRRGEDDAGLESPASVALTQWQVTLGGPELRGRRMKCQRRKRRR